jgi:hypothetical protein
MKRAGIVGTIASAAMLTAAALPAQAATPPSWRAVETHHYGAAANYSGYGTALATSSKNAWVLGGSDILNGLMANGQPVAVHWNGHAWSGSTLPSKVTGNIVAASAPAANDIWAVTAQGGWVLHYNGSSWAVATQLNAKGNGGLSLQTMDVVAFSATNVWVFGGSEALPGVGTWHYNGSKWTQVTTAGSEGDLTYASATSASSIWALGGFGVPAADSIVHYNGHAWTSANSSYLNGLNLEYLSALPGKVTDLWVSATAQSSQSYLLHYGDHWSKALVPWGLSIRSSVASDGQSGLWFEALAKTGSQWMVHWLPGNKWQRVEVSRVAGAPALIPGTSALLAGGNRADNPSGTTAVVWAYGNI